MNTVNVLILGYLLIISRFSNFLLSSKETIIFPSCQKYKYSTAYHLSNQHPINIHSRFLYMSKYALEPRRRISRRQPSADTIGYNQSPVITRHASKSRSHSIDIILTVPRTRRNSVSQHSRVKRCCNTSSPEMLPVNINLSYDQRAPTERRTSSSYPRLGVARGKINGDSREDSNAYSKIAL